MSIAVSFLIRPSVWLNRLVILLSGLVCVALWATLSLKNEFFPFVWRVGLVLVCAGIYAWRLYTFFSQQKVYGFYVSNVGKIVIHSEFNKERSVQREQFFLDTSSVIWPYILSLQLRNENRTLSLLVLPDSVSGEEFRRLSIAMRWLASQGVKIGT